jgi:tetratricopeptide (TPR) repeat protein
MNKILTLFLLLLCVLPVYAAETNNDRISKAMSFYAQGNYNESIKEYEIMIMQGFYNPYIFHNLANAYYKTGDIGRASLNTERALRLAPRDKDIRYNRKLLAELAKEPEPNTAEFIIQEISFFVSLNEITFIASALFMFLCLCFGLYCLKKQKIFFKGVILFSALFILSGALFYVKFNQECIMCEAVILTDTPVRNKPIKTEETAFEVYAGRKVVVLSELGKWVNIKLLLDGFSGWVDKNSLEII